MRVNSDIRIGIAIVPSLSSVALQMVLGPLVCDPIAFTSVDSLLASEESLSGAIVHVNLLQEDTWSKLQDRMRGKAVIIMDPSFSDEKVIQLAHYGATYFLSETESSPIDVEKTIRDALSGVSNFPSPLVFALIMDLRLQACQRLTRRETEILDLIVLGHSDEEIADCLFLSKHSIKKHVRTILKKTNSRNRTQAAAYRLTSLSRETGLAITSPLN